MSKDASQESHSLKRPRRPTVTYQHMELPMEVLAVLRLTWFKKGRPRHVEEFSVYECEGGAYVFAHALNEAVATGVDVCVLSQHDPETLGFIS